ncbi:MAG TPA: hypothetical protein DGK91_11060 [Clostridium sp.]|nr:hypothetical protein [Clostridium sp.]
MVIDKDVTAKYHEYYFHKYPRRNTLPIKSPIPPSLNKWMIMPRHQMNNEKQKWKEFGEWLVTYYKYNNLLIDKCDVVVTYYFGSKHRHDADNYSPKFLFVGFTAGGLFKDDDFEHIRSLMIKGDYCKGNPMVEFEIICEQKEMV